MSSTDAKPAAAPADPASKSMDAIVALAKRRGFVYPASEIYGGLNGFWDYGPLGTLLKNNIRDHWWKHMVECPPLDPDTGEPIQMVGLDSAIIQNPKTWKASGHVGGFNDPMIDDKELKHRFRADHFYGLYLAPANDEELHRLVEEERLGLATHHAHLIATAVASGAGEALRNFQENEKKLLKPWTIEEVFGNPDGIPVEFGRCLNHKSEESQKFVVWPISPVEMEKNAEKAISPFSGTRGTLTEPRMFNLMFETYVGAIRNEDAKAYLRPETAQGIFLNYKNVLDTMRVKVPFGIAQIGKSFRNEITPRNFIFRSREFEQMEMEWFCAPDESQKWYDFWKGERMKWWLSLGVDPRNLCFRDHDPDELAHYSKMCVDVEYKYPFTAPGYGELEGVAHRGCFDLTQHQEHSGQKMEYFDQARQLAAKEAGKSKEEIDAESKYIPNVIEPASGLTRAVLVLLCEAYTEDPDRPSGVYMKFHPRFAPIKAAILPLVNKDGMPEKARELYMKLRERHTVELDVKQNIGKRYARQDEIGTPMCFTIDGQTMEDDTVTVRHRDTLEQERIPLVEVPGYLDERVWG
jgi:glycyl-tRNA synthetase